MFAFHDIKSFEQKNKQKYME